MLLKYNLRYERSLVVLGRVILFLLVKHILQLCKHSLLVASCNSLCLSETYTTALRERSLNTYLYSTIILVKLTMTS
jgi:hypothetical protein